MPRRWGCDSCVGTYIKGTNGAAQNETLAAYALRYARSGFGDVVFWARYFYPTQGIGCTIGWETLAAEEVAELRRRGINWLVPICSPPSTSGNYTSGYNDGRAFAEAIANGISANIGMYLPTLRLDVSGNPILRVYLNIESEQQILSLDYWQGWSYGVRTYVYQGKNPFFPCAYCDPTPERRDQYGNLIHQDVCPILGFQTGFYTCHGIWSSEPSAYPGGPCFWCDEYGPELPYWQPATCNDPARGVVDGGGAKLWQYAIAGKCRNCGRSRFPDVDYDESTPSEGDDELYYMLYLPPSIEAAGTLWSPWAWLGGVLTESPAATKDGGSGLWVFARGTDNALYYRTTGDGVNWSSWASLGGVATSAPAAATGTRLCAFVRGSDNALYSRSTTDGANWTGWVSLRTPPNGGLTSAPAATRDGGTRLWVFARGADNALWYCTSGDGLNWSPWASLGGVLTAAPAAATLNGRLYAFARGSDNRLYQRSTSDGTTWTAWAVYGDGGNLTAAPAAAVYTPSGGTARMYTFARGTDGALYERSTADGVNYTGWASLGGEPVGAPAAAGVGNRLYTFARRADNALWERHTPH